MDGFVAFAFGFMALCIAFAALACGTDSVSLLLARRRARKQENYRRNCRRVEEWARRNGAKVVDLHPGAGGDAA
jgi:hypothetical protein